MTKTIEMTAKSSKREKLEHLSLLMDKGEKLGYEICGKLCEYGCSEDGLCVETYAMAKAMGSLNAVAKSEGFDTMKTFEKLVPFFEEIMKRELERIAKEDKQNS